MSGAGAAVAGADMEAGADTVEAGGEEADSTGQGGEAIPEKDSERCDPSRSFSDSIVCRDRLSPVGGGVEAPWFECESRCRIVWLMKNRQRPTGDDCGAESIVELAGVLTCSCSIDPV